MGDVIIGVVFAFYGWRCLPWLPSQRAIFGWSFLETRLQSESLEGLICFLAFRDPKLWLKNPHFAKNKKVVQKVW